MKLYTAVTYNLKMCMKEDNPDPKNIKGDNSREKMICVGGDILCDLTQNTYLVTSLHKRFGSLKIVVKFWSFKSLDSAAHINTRCSHTASAM